MKFRHKQGKASGKKVAKRRKSTDPKAAAKRRSSNTKINASLKTMYDDVVNEPVPSQMTKFDGLK